MSRKKTKSEFMFLVNLVIAATVIYQVSKIIETTKPKSA